MCEQREKRLDEDDLITEFQKTIEVVKKEKETAAKKQKVVEQGLAAIQQEITEFQREKQVRDTIEPCCGTWSGGSSPGIEPSEPFKHYTLFMRCGWLGPAAL